MVFSLIDKVQAVGQNGGTTAGINTTGANLIVLSIASWIAPDPGISDSKSNTWVPLNLTDGFNVEHQLYYCAAPIVGSGHTFTFSGSGTLGVLGVQAWSGAHATTPFDVQSSFGDPGNFSSGEPGSITPSQNDELIVTGCAAGSATLSINSGFTISDSAANLGGSNIAGGMAYLVQTTAAAVNPTWSFGGISDFGMNIAAFKASAEGSLLAVFGVGTGGSVRRRHEMVGY